MSLQEPKDKAVVEPKKKKKNLTAVIQMYPLSFLKNFKSIFEFHLYWFMGQSENASASSFFSLHIYQGTCLDSQ